MRALRIHGSAAAAAAAAAGRVARLLRRRRPTVLVLATGKTMVLLYREIVRLHREGRAPFGRATVFPLDELAVSPEDPRSFRSFLERHLVSKVDLPPERFQLLRGDAADPDREGRRYERALERSGPPDLVLLGIGANGHIAYLEPGQVLPPRTSRVRLSAATRRALAEEGMSPVPRDALTMGIETVLSGRELLLLATGRAKAHALARALEGPVTPRCPASFVSLHPALTVVADRAASSALTTPRGV